MGKNAKAAAQRAKKKQQKDKKRQQKNQAEKQRRQLAGALSSVLPRGPGAILSGPARFGQPYWEPATDGILGLARKESIHPHVAAWRIDEDVELDDIDLPDAVWTLEKITGLETRAILVGLEERGVHADQAAFVERARALGSAWKVAEELWAPALGEQASVHDEDFLGLAAYALWKEWCPEVPSRERVIDLLSGGMAALEDDEEAVAADCWIEAWDRMKPFLTPDVRTLGAAEDLLEIDESLHSWVEHLTMVADNAGLTDAGVAVRASRVVEEVLAQFASEDDHLRRDLSSDIGTLLFRAGRPEDGERVLRELIAAFPEHAAGYVSLADAWPEDRAYQERSLALLEEAAARVEDAEDWDLEPRIEALRAALAKPSGG